jgi:hypothetical protein
MLLAIITLFTALAMASAAAWFAIVGIMAIFAGLPTYALVMGCVVELGKVVGVSWVYRNWQEPTRLKYIAIPPIILAMMLTSMGIFGLLSKAHLEQTSPVANNAAIIERLDQQIAREQRQIADTEMVVEQLDETVNTLIRFSRISGPEGARAVRAGQEGQRSELRQIISVAQAEIDQLEDRKLQLATELRAIELEVGPIRYIAAMIYDDHETRIEEAVRWVIIAFIFVFDPMAIILLMCANYSLMLRKPKPTLTPPTEETLHIAASQKLDDDLHSPPEEHIVTSKGATTFKPNATATFRPGKVQKDTTLANHGMKYGLLKSEGKK